MKNPTNLLNQVFKFFKEQLTEEKINQRKESMKRLWKNIPEQMKRLVFLAVLLIVVFAFVRSILVPPDFGEHGHFRSSVVEEIVSQDIQYAGQEICADCHDDMMEEKSAGYHRNVSCEVCHGPAAGHAEEPESTAPEAPRQRGFCPLCHEYNSSRPTGFPQIIAASHNPMKPCITCHNPHDPRPPETPRNCSACHPQIARTKALSHHVYVECTHCHQTPEEHKLNPRGVLPEKPSTREFCGGCHAKPEAASKGIPQVDLATHNSRYVCWQCHYPHLPEAR